MTAGQILQLRQRLNLDLVFVDGLVPKHSGKSFESFLSPNANHQRRIFAREFGGGPANEFGEVKKKGRFKLVFIGNARRFRSTKAETLTCGKCQQHCQTELQVLRHCAHSSSAAHRDKTGRLT